MISFKLIYSLGSHTTGKLEQPRRVSAAVLVSIVVSMITACDSQGGATLAPDGTLTPPSSIASQQPNSNLVFAPAAALAAAPVPSSTLADLNIPAQAISLQDLQDQIFQPYCAGCHTGGDNELPGSLNLSSASDTYASTIGTLSSEDPQYELIAPDESTHSYLVRKLEGTQSVGQQMPLQGGPLPQWMVTAVKRWIDSGAVY